MARIIVVDDDYGTSSLVKMLLEMEGFLVSTFTDSSSVLDDLQDDVAAFIIDCYLGKDPSGIDLLRSVRHHEDRTVKEAPVIMVSGDQRLESKAKAAGADLFMVKPYSTNDLTKEVRALIAARSGQVGT